MRDFRAESGSGSPWVLWTGSGALTRTRARIAGIAFQGLVSSRARSRQVAGSWNSRATRAADRTNRSGLSRYGQTASTALRLGLPWKVSSFRRAARARAFRSGDVAGAVDWSPV